MKTDYLPALGPSARSLFAISCLALPAGIPNTQAADPAQGGPAKPPHQRHKPPRGGKVDPAAIASFRTANMLRVTADVWDDEKDLNECFNAWRKWSGHEQPGFWIDMDLIIFGQLLLTNPPTAGAASGSDIVLAGKGAHRWSGFPRDQALTFITLRALSASPLMMGGDLLTLDAFSHQLLINPDMIACNQNGVMGHLAQEANGIEIWLTPQRNTGGQRGWVGVFNRSWRDATLQLTPALLGFGSNVPEVLRDIWNGSRL